MIEDTDIRIEDLPERFREIAEAIGMAAAVALVRACGGDEIYIPKSDSIRIAARNRMILAEHRAGVDYFNLARKYNLTTVHVRNIIGAATQRRTMAGVDIIDKQLALF